MSATHPAGTPTHLEFSAGGVFGVFRVSARRYSIASLIPTVSSNWLNCEDAPVTGRRNAIEVCRGHARCWRELLAGEAIARLADR